MPIVNRNSYGYFKVYDSSGRVVLEKVDVACSQAIKKTLDINVDNGKIVFYFPSDYLSKTCQNEEFFNYWLSLASEFFHKVKYLGISASKELGMNFDKIREGYRDKEDLVRDLGNFVFNDRWCVFEMKIKNNSLEIQNRQYCAYCMIRYMFSDHYGQIIKNFNRFSFIARNFALKITEFELFQISHYYFAGNFGFYQTYVIVHLLDRNDYLSRVLTQGRFNEYIKVNEPINVIFNKGGKCGMTVSEFQKRIELNEIKAIYEAIK